MKASKPSELRQKTADELDKLAAEKAENLFNLKLRHAAGRLESSADLAATRKDLARVKTLAAEKRRAEQAGK
jgi:large subunit ribosomal protein L29